MRDGGVDWGDGMLVILPGWRLRIWRIHLGMLVACGKKGLSDVARLKGEYS